MTRLVAVTVLAVAVLYAAGTAGANIGAQDRGATCSAPCERDASGRAFAGWNAADVRCFEDEVLIGRRHDTGSDWYFTCTPADNVRLRMTHAERAALGRG